MIDQHIKTVREGLTILRGAVGNEENNHTADIALTALDAIEQAMREPPNWIDLQKEADAIVRGKYVFRRFIDGTPLENDIACWMAEFASEKLKATPPAQQAQPSEAEVKRNAYAKWGTAVEAALNVQTQAEAVPSDVVRDAMVEAAYDAVAAALGDAYDCTRCWSAWSYGTMGPDDFSQVAEDGDRVREIAGAAIDAAMAQGEKP